MIVHIFHSMRQIDFDIDAQRNKTSVAMIRVSCSDSQRNGIAQFFGRQVHYDHSHDQAIVYESASRRHPATFRIYIGMDRP